MRITWLLALLWLTPARAEVTVLAASSLTDAMTELGRAWTAQGHAAPRFVFGASSMLARQIEQGIPADLFVSADEPWADYLDQRHLLVPGTRMSPLSNHLVLIAPAYQASDQPGDRPGKLELGPGVDLLARLGPDGRIATADPASVPAGKYAEAALRSLGVWDRVEPRLARTVNVRAALLLVERGEAPLGIVYATDAAADSKVRVLGSFPDATHSPIRYPFALVQDTAEARALLAFLTGPGAAPVYRRLGFKVEE